MAARDTLERALRRAFSLLNEPRARRLAQVLLALGLVFLALRVRSAWHGSHIALGSVSWPPAVGALMAAALAVVAAACAWLGVLRLLGAPATRRCVPVYLLAQFAKYVPGGVWQYAGRTALARDVGIPARTTGLSITVEIASALTASLTLSLLLFGVVGVTAALILLAVAAALSRVRRGRTRRSVTAGVLLYLPSVVLCGASLWLVARALLPDAGAGVLFYVGAWSAAWAAGLVVVFAPGGIGVREAVIVALLRPHLGTADAAVVAAASRLVVTLADAAAAALGASLHRRRPRVRTTPAVGDA